MSACSSGGNSSGKLGVCGRELRKDPTIAAIQDHALSISEGGKRDHIKKILRFRTSGLYIASLIIIALCPASCKQNQMSPAPSHPSVTVVEVAPKDVPVAMERNAQLQSSHLVNIHARVSGFLDKRLYTEGTVVKAGQVLFQMDAKPFQVQLDQAKAALAQHEATLETARQNLARVKPLAEVKAVSQKDLDNANGQFNSAASVVEQAKAQVESAKLNLSYTTIASPIDGVSSAALQTEGTYINMENSQLTTVAVLSPIWVNFSFSENEMQKYRNDISRGLLQVPKNGNYEVEIMLVDGSVFPYTGRITFAEPSYNAQTGTFMVRATVNNPKGLLRPNQYVGARLKGAVRPNAILLPQRAVLQGAKSHFVWVIDKENKAEQRPVTVGDWYGDDWFILEGLKAGDRVVVDGSMAIRSGMPVDAKPYESKAASSSSRGAPEAGAADKNIKQGGTK